PVCSYIKIVCAAKRNSAGFGAEHSALSVRRDRHQTDHSVGDDQVSAAIEHQTERAALRAREHLRSGSVWLKTKDAAIVGATVDSIITVEGDVFGREGLNLQSFNFGELGI